MQKGSDKMLVANNLMFSLSAACGIIQTVHIAHRVLTVTLQRKPAHIVVKPQDK